MPVVELKVDRNLVHSDFAGYKLTFDPVPVLRQEHEYEAHTVQSSSNQFSLLHTELFAQHNHLVADPWMRHCSYFFNNRHQLVQCNYDLQTGNALAQRVVLTVDYNDQGDEELHRPGDYNYTIVFVSERFCVICDGMTSYHLVDTGDRSRTGVQDWERITRSPVNNNSGNRGFALFDARLDVLQERKQISLVAGHVARRDAVGPDQTHVYYMDLTWARWTLSPTNKEWSYNICQRLETTGSLHYCAFEPRADSLVIASNHDVQTPEERRAADEAAAARLNAPDDHDGQLENGGPPSYSWSQTDDNVLICFNVPSTASAEEFDVSGSNTTVVVKHLDEVIFTEELYARVVDDLSALKLADNGLELSLTKAEIQNWPRLLAQENDDVPEEVHPIQAPPLTIPNLQDPVEECDIISADEEIRWVIFTEELYARVVDDLSALKLADNGLELSLTKAEIQNWPRLLAQENDDVPEEVHPIQAPPLTIPNLQDPVEECDIISADEEIKMVRFNLTSRSITHTVFLGPPPLVLTTTLRPGFPAAFSTRQGVDASIWLQMYQPSRPDEWSVRHEGQLHAFGYVQASKVVRKFTVCSPDLDYVVICDPVRYLLLYFPSRSPADGLRRRNGPPVTLGKQNFITLDDAIEEILGITTANNVITILSNRELVRLQV
ncbi:GD15964 [Drosophila simulans]|uniref:NudC domain-containing protein 1 n=1 Tax=Drosophila simulans TaxID=7240 RepID=B4R387_DROSI|nr:GD15964 [Drosophila simulans]